VRKIGTYMKPAHTHLINIRQTPVVEFPDEWVLGIDELGEGTVLTA